uniref:Putative secreted peptide n=1 Tax=Hyalomma excavatum TaxID=257692 RepID=A0A131XGT9_9ACAR
MLPVSQVLVALLVNLAPSSIVFAGDAFRSKVPPGTVELDLLKMLNISTLHKGVGRTTGPISSLPAWKLFSGLNAVQIPLEPESSFQHQLASSGALSAIFVTRPNRHSVATLFSIHLPGKMSPLVRVAVNFRTRRFVLSYTVPDYVVAMSSSDEDEGGDRATNRRDLDTADDVSEADVTDQVTDDADETFRLNSADVRHVKFKLASAKTLKKTHGWTWIAVTLTREKVTLYENCEKPVEVELVHSPLLRFPSDALVYFRQEPGLKRKFVGSVQVARLYSNRITSRPWKCSSTGTASLGE